LPNVEKSDRMKRFDELVIVTDFFKVILRRLAAINEYPILGVSSLSANVRFCRHSGH